MRLCPVRYPMAQAKVEHGASFVRGARRFGKGVRRCPCGVPRQGGCVRSAATKIVLSALLFAALLPSNGHAQGVDTHLTPTAGVGDLGTTVTQMDTVFEITGGTRPDDGPNLFHSFAEFSLGSDTIADFVNDSGLATENIVGRVTGGVRSEIDGTIRTTGFPGASLFLLNPTGLSFGPNAVLDVEGSLHASTADYLRLGANQRFFADPLEVSSLSTAPAVGLWFLAASS